MSEEDAALFWRVDTTTDPGSGKKSPDSALGLTEATLVKGLCLGTMTLLEPVIATSAPAIKCSTVKVAPAETAQDTKPAVQPQATNTVDVNEIQNAKAAIQRLRQVTTGTQTENENGLHYAETLNLKETLSEDASSNTPIETTSFGLTQPKDIRVRRKGRRKANPAILVKATCSEPDLWTVLPFAQATWRSTHHLRAVTYAEDVDPRVLEVLDLPIL